MKIVKIRGLPRRVRLGNLFVPEDHAPTRGSPAGRNSASTAAPASAPRSMAWRELLIGQDPRAHQPDRRGALFASRAPSRAGSTRTPPAQSSMPASTSRARRSACRCYELFGGAVRERIPVYWSRCGVIRARCAEYFDGKVIDRPAVRKVDDLVAAAREARERGFKAIKMQSPGVRREGRPPVHAGLRRAGRAIPSSTCPRRCSTRCSPSSQRCAKAAAPGVRIAVDLNFNYKAEGFRRIAKKVEPFDLMWLEMDIYEPQALAADPPVDHDTDRVARDHPRAARAEALPRSHCVDVAIIDPQYNGVPEAVRMAATVRRLRGQRRLALFQRAALRDHLRAFCRGDPEPADLGIRCRRGAVEAEAAQHIRRWSRTASSSSPPAPAGAPT